MVHAIPYNRAVPIEKAYIFKSIAIKRKFQEYNNAKKSCLLLVFLIVSLLAACSEDTKTGADQSGKRQFQLDGHLI